MQGRHDPKCGNTPNQAVPLEVFLLGMGKSWQAFDKNVPVGRTTNEQTERTGRNGLSEGSSTCCAQ